MAELITYILSFGFIAIASACVLIPGFLLGLVLIYFIIKRRRDADKKKMDLILSGVSAPAVIISAHNNYLTGGGRHSPPTDVVVTFNVEVQPENGAPFQATLKEHVLIQSERDLQLGERREDAGRKIWVAYNPNDKSQITFDHYDSSHEYMMKRRDFEKTNQRHKELLKTGRSAVAQILEVEDLKLTDDFEKNLHLCMRLKLLITSGNEPTYEAETQAAIATKSLYKYEVGKKVKVKVDQKDKNFVALEGSLEG